MKMLLIREPLQPSFARKSKWDSEVYILRNTVGKDKLWSLVEVDHYERGDINITISGKGSSNDAYYISSEDVFELIRCLANIIIESGTDNAMFQIVDQEEALPETENKTLPLQEQKGEFDDYDPFLDEEHEVNKLPARLDDAEEDSKDYVREHEENHPDIRQESEPLNHNFF